MDTKKKSSDTGRLAAEIHELGPFIHPPCPNPAPLGLFAFGLTTALLQVKHTGLGGETEEDGRGTENLVWGYAVFFGGLLQLIAGAVEIKRNNIFGFTAFSTYGGFWLSLAAAHLFIDADSDILFNSRAVQAMLVLMGIFTFIMWLCTLKMNATISLLFFLLATTFFLLAGGVVNTTVDKVAGWVGMVTAATAYWLAAAELINDIVGGGKDVVPLWRFKPSNTGAVHVAGRLHGEGQRQALKGTSMGRFLRRASVPTNTPMKEEGMGDEIDIENGSSASPYTSARVTLEEYDVEGGDTPPQ
jgi:succinate-acetate transporter protein